VTIILGVTIIPFFFILHNNSETLLLDMFSPAIRDDRYTFAVSTIKSYVKRVVEIETKDTKVLLEEKLIPSIRKLAR